MNGNRVIHKRLSLLQKNLHVQDFSHVVKSSQRGLTWQQETCPHIVKFIPQSSQHILVYCRYGIPDSVFDLLYGLAEKLETYVCVKK